MSRTKELRWLVRGAIAFALHVGSASGQVYVVDPAGRGDFDDLQTALDAVPADSTLMVKGTWRSLRVFVNKGVTIVGLRIFTRFGDFSGSTPDDAMIEVDAGADADVKFDRLSVTLEASWTSEGTRGLNVWSARNVTIVDSTIECSTTMATSCETYDHNGDAIVIGDASTVSIVRSAIRGGSGWIVWSGCQQGCDYNYDRRPRGGHAVKVEGSVGLLLAEESVLQGGDGCEVGFDGVGCFPPVAAPRGGDGGHAIDHPSGTTWLSGCQLLPGAGARGWTDGCDPPLEDFGAPGLELTGPSVALGALLAVDPGDLGWDLAVVGRGFAPDRLALLFVSTALAGPIRIRQGPWFLGSPFVYVGAVPTDPSGAFLLHDELPSDPQLSGMQLVFQATDLTVLSEPGVVVLRPRE